MLIGLTLVAMPTVVATRELVYFCFSLLCMHATLSENVSINTHAFKRCIKATIPSEAFASMLHPAVLACNQESLSCVLRLSAAAFYGPATQQAICWQHLVPVYPPSTYRPSKFYSSISTNKLSAPILSHCILFLCLLYMRNELRICAVKGQHFNQQLNFI